MIKVLIVDDSVVVREILNKIISQEEGMEVVGTAPDAYVAREKIIQLNPDLITLDVEMPRMDGITFLKKLMQHLPIPVIIISTLTQKGSRIAMEALEVGAVEVLAKPSDVFSLEDMAVELVSKIRAAAMARVSSPNAAAIALPQVRRPAVPLATGRLGKIIAIGASTGGVQALKAVFAVMPAESPPVLLVQHMPQTFTETLAQHLNEISKMTVKEAQNGDIVQPGLALLARGGYHMVLRSRGAQCQVEVKEGPRVSGHIPSVDALFGSVATTVGANSVGVIMTGMGADGARGMLEMHKAGAVTLAQDEASCVVYGMPMEARRIGAVTHSVTLADLPEAILRAAGGPATTSLSS